MKGKFNKWNNRAPSWNFKKAKWDVFTQYTETKTSNIQLGKNVNENTKTLNTIMLDAAKRSIPRGHRNDYKPFWTSKLDTLHKDLERKREEMERNPTDKSVAAHNKAKALFTREKLTETRNSWHEKTSSLDMEKDLQGLWKLTKTLNEDYTSKTKIVIEENNELHSERKAAYILA